MARRRAAVSNNLLGRSALLKVRQYIRVHHDRSACRVSARYFASRNDLSSNSPPWKFAVSEMFLSK
jgi:hypothetical protein